MSNPSDSDLSYGATFLGDGVSADSKAARALAVALDVRKFEIELYWKRASYFWVFSGAALVGHLTAAASLNRNYQSEAMLLTACIGIVFSFAWYLVNRASKFWQSNWEGHVDLLEDQVHGPLYKTVLSDEVSAWRLNDAYPLSISKLNQVLSFLVFLVFCLLAANVAIKNYEISSCIDLFPTGCLLLTVASLVLLPLLSRSGKGNRNVRRELRRAVSRDRETSSS